MGSVHILDIKHSQIEDFNLGSPKNIVKFGLQQFTNSQKLNVGISVVEILIEINVWFIGMWTNFLIGINHVN